MVMKIEIVQVTTDEQRLSAYKIREEVFVREQQVPLGLERDAMDEKAQHILALVNGFLPMQCTSAASQSAENSIYVGTARAFQNPDCAEEIMIGRVAVLKRYRRLGIARKMTAWLIDWGRTQGFRRARLHAQSYIVSLYARLGFAAHGPEFLEAGIPHQEMVLEF